jgi:hypothetical protein
MAERQAECELSAPYDKLLRADETPAFGGSLCADLFPPFGIPLGSLVCGKLQKPISAGNCVKILGKPS